LPACVMEEIASMCACHPPRMKDHPGLRYAVCTCYAQTSPTPMMEGISLCVYVTRSTKWGTPKHAEPNRPHTIITYTRIKYAQNHIPKIRIHKSHMHRNHKHKSHVWVLCVCVCACVCARACVRACVCVRVCVRT